MHTHFDGQLLFDGSQYTLQVRSLSLGCIAHILVIKLSCFFKIKIVAMFQQVTFHFLLKPRDITGLVISLISFSFERQSTPKVEITFQRSQINN